MTRRTAKVFDRLLDALDLHKVLTAANIDSKIVTKHAVQVLPEQYEQAKQAAGKEKQRRGM